MTGRSRTRAYESAAATFIQSLFSEPSDLLNELADFAQRIAPAGAANGLAQTLIRLTAPGVPDIYQGTEYWDLSLVDPDNRSLVDFAARKHTLDRAFPADLAATWRDGRIKQAMIAHVLATRSRARRLFSEGNYIPLETTGALSQHVVAFARTFRIRQSQSWRPCGYLCVSCENPRGSQSGVKTGGTRASPFRPFFVARFAPPCCIATRSTFFQRR